MHWKKLLLIIAVFSLLISIKGTHAQNVTLSHVVIEGEVRDCKNSSYLLKDVNISAKYLNGLVINSTVTNDQGKYKLELKNLNTSTIRLEAWKLGHATTWKIINITNNWMKIDFSLGSAWPNMTVITPGDVFIGENFQIHLLFKNTGNNTGFQPCVGILLPPEIEFINATFLGYPVHYDTTWERPYWAPQDYKWIVLYYPLGSFTPNQPVADMTVNLKLSSNAALGSLFNITAQPFFYYGNDPLWNPSIDPIIWGDLSVGTIKAVALKINKTVELHENETATGPNYHFNFKISVDVANGITLNNVTIQDELPGNLQFVKVLDAGGGVIVSQPSNSTPGGILTIHFDSITGQQGIDKIIEYEVYAPKFDNNSNYVLDPTTGSPVLSQNNCTATALYGNYVVTSTSSSLVYLKSLAIQKIVQDLNGTNPKPGDTLEYYINFQISDFFRISNFTVNDTISDGQSFDDSFTPLLNLTIGNITITNQQFSPGTYNVTHNNDGTWTVIFNVTQLLISLGFSGVLVGGLNETSNNAGPTYGSITFRTKIDTYWENPANYVNTSNLKSGDIIHNYAVGSGVLDSGNLVKDDTKTDLLIQGPVVEKSVYAINGNTSVSFPYPVRPGDNVTYSLKLIVPTSNVENLTIYDYLPIPFFNATQITSYQNKTLPDPGYWTLGPEDNMTAFIGRLPTLEVLSSDNALKFSYGTINSTDQLLRVIHILFTVTATNESFGDKLYLSNLAYIQFSNSTLYTSSLNAITQVLTQEPYLILAKGIFDIAHNWQWLENTTADANDTIDFAIVIKNYGHADAYNVTIKDIIPSVFTNVTIVEVYNWCSQNNTLIYGQNYTGNLTDGLVIFKIPTAFPIWNDTVFNPEGVVTIHYRATLIQNVTPSAEYNNTAKIIYYSSIPDGPNYIGDPIIDNATVDIPPVSISKEIINSSDFGTNASNLTIGENATFCINVTLPESYVDNLTITDVLPPGISYANYYYIDTTGFNGVLANCTFYQQGNNITFLFNGTSVCYADNDPSNNTFKILLNVTVTNDYSANPHSISLNKTNHVEANWSNNIRGPTTFDYNFTVVQPLLNVTKVISPPVVFPGQEVTITIKVRNDGLSPAYWTYISDVLDPVVFNTLTVKEISTPPGFTFRYNLLNGTVEYIPNPGEIDPGVSLDFVFNVTTLTSTLLKSVNNTANVTYNSLNNTNVSDNRVYKTSASAVLSLSAADLSIEKNASATTARLGDMVTFTITVKNNGPDNATDVNVTDMLPSGLEFVRSEPAGIYDPNTRTLTWKLDHIGVNETVVIKVWVRVVTTGTIINIVNVTCGIDYNVKNNKAKSSLKVIMPTKPLKPGKPHVLKPPKPTKIKFLKRGKEKIGKKKIKIPVTGVPLTYLLLGLILIILGLSDRRKT